MENTLSEKAESAFEAFHSTKDAINQDTYSNVLKGLSLSDQQKDYIASKFSLDASGKRFDQVSVNLNNTFEQNAAHGFVDTLKKSGVILSSVAYEVFDDDTEMHEVVSQYKNTLETALDNARTLHLDEDFVLNMQIDHIQRVVVDTFDDILKTLEKRGISSQPSHSSPEGVECIGKIEPEELNL